MKRFNGHFTCYDCECYSNGCCSVYKTKVNKSSKNAEYCDAFENFEEVYEKRLIEEEEEELDKAMDKCRDYNF